MRVPRTHEPMRGTPVAHAPRLGPDGPQSLLHCSFGCGGTGPAHANVCVTTQWQGGHAGRGPRCPIGTPRRSGCKATGFCVSALDTQKG